MSKLNDVNSTGLTQTGNIIQSITLTGTVKAGADNDALLIEVSELYNRTLRGLKGSIEMFEVNASTLSSEAANSAIVIKPLVLEGPGKIMFKMGGLTKGSHRRI